MSSVERATPSTIARIASGARTFARTLSTPSGVEKCAIGSPAASGASRARAGSR
jgi:hypothetical protein